MTLKQLRFFCRVVDAGSITQAARELNVAQTAVGVQVRGLETLLSTRLLERHARGVSPTSAGRAVYERAHRIVGEADLLAADVRNAAARASRTLSIGMVPSMIRAVGARALLHEHEALAGVRLRLVEGLRNELLAKLKSGQLHYAYLQDVEDEVALWSTPVLRQSVVLLSASSGRKFQRPISLADATKGPLLVRSGTCWICDRLVAAATEKGLAPSIDFEIASDQAILEIVASGRASAIVAGDAFADYVALGTVDARPIIDPTIDLTLCLAGRARSRPDRRDRAILDLFGALLDDFCALHECRNRRLSASVPDKMPAAQGRRDPLSR